MASDDAWKEKYFQELEQAEQREQQWQEERHLLERMLVRTSLASQGQRPELDDLLGRLRDDLKRQKIDLNTWRQLQDQIDQQVALLDEPEQLLSAPRGSDVAPANEDETNLEESGQRLRIARRVGQLLGHLLRQVSLDTETEARARALQQNLLASNDWELLRESLNQVAELVIEAVSRSQKEFEAFLKRLDERLEKLRQHFTEQTEVQSSRQDDTTALNHEIREELERVSDEIHNSTDLNALKVSVSQRLEFIGNSLERFRNRENKREELLSEQLQTMQEKVAAMEAHSEQMKSQIRKERERAMTDLLTQLPNREAWQERLSFEFNRWQRYRQPLTVAILDIDLFKRINDSYGHKAGDRVLQLVARELNKRLRKTDFIARFGGEEFVVLLPQTGAVEAEKVIDGLREFVARLPFHFGGKPVSITFSAGIAQFAGGDAEDAVFDRADRALYLAKEKGRNRVVID